MASFKDMTSEIVFRKITYKFGMCFSTLLESDYCMHNRNEGH